MRRILALAAVAVTISLTTNAEAYFPGQRWQPCDNLPPASARQPVNSYIKVDEYTVSTDRMWVECHIVKRDGVIYGCTYRTPHYDKLTHHSVDVWRVFFNASLNVTEKACTRLIEYGHIPPNSWSNSTVEGMTHHTAN